MDNYETVTKLTDLSRSVTKAYLAMASDTKVQKKVSKFIRSLIMDADESEEYTHFRFYDRAYKIVEECQHVALRKAIMKTLIKEQS